MIQDFQTLPHTADIKVRVVGDSLEDFFRHAVQGMFQAIGPIVPSCSKEGDRIVCKELPSDRSISVQAHDLTSLLVDFLSEVLYLSDVHNEAYLDVTVTAVTPTSIEAVVHGIPVDGFEVVEIKAVTYHDLDVKQIDGRWQADIVFDI